MKKYVLLFALLFSPLLSSFAALPPTRFVVLIPSYNNEKWCQENLASVVKQTYPWIEIIYVDDCSKDQTGALVDKYVREHNLQNRCRVIHNPVRRGAMANIYNNIKDIDPKKVVAVLDGDDKLADLTFFERLDKIYNGTGVWLTHGNYFTDPFTKRSTCTAYPSFVQKNRTFRSYRWMGCALRTFYAGLFQEIKKEDLMYKGEFLPMSQDFAIMFPMLEMASRGHIYFVEDKIYCVNTNNPISDRRKNRYLQQKLATMLRGMPPYRPLKTLFPVATYAAN
jgi:glycosyltransferase involved in cell wall biosynthesis